MIKKNSKRAFSLPLKLLLSLMILFFAWVGKTALTTPLPLEGSAPLLYSNQCRDDLRLTFCNAIEQAQNSVYLLIFSLKDHAIIHSLRHAAERGVKVTVIYDGTENHGLAKRLGSKVSQIKRFAPGLMHQKILIVDERQIWIGSANMTQESLRMHGNLVIAFDSASLSKLLIANMQSRHSRAPPAPFSIHEYCIGGQKLEYWQLPSDGEALQRLITLINGAQKSLKIAMFTWTHPQLVLAVINAHRRGVQVEVVIDATSGRGVSNRAYKQLQSEGIPAFLSLGPELLHHKFAWIDEKILINGSANWTRAAFKENDDCFIVLHDLSAQQRKFLTKLWDIIRLETQIN